MTKIFKSMRQEKVAADTVVGEQSSGETIVVDEFRYILWLTLLLVVRRRIMY